MRKGSKYTKHLKYVQDNGKEIDMKKTNSVYSIKVDGKCRKIRDVREHTKNSFIAYYAKHYIEVSMDDADKDYPKPWYAWCIHDNGSYAVDGWVGKTMEEAISVCIQNIYFKSN